MIKLLITGGTGFFGRSILRYLKSKYTNNNLTVSVFSRSPKNFHKKYPIFKRHPFITFYDCDVLKYESFPKKTEFTHVIHAAAESTFGKKINKLEWFNQIINGTKNILDYAIDAGATRFLYVSSGAIYGMHSNKLEFIKENSLISPDPLIFENVYGNSKRTAETLCTIYSNLTNLEAMVARCFTFSGPDLPLDAHFAFGNFLNDALNSESIKINGDGSAIRSYLDQADLAEWLWKILIHGRSGNAYNVGSDQNISIKELAYRIRDQISPNKNIEYFMTPNTLNNCYVPSVEKIKKELKVVQNISLENSIKKTFLYHKFNKKNFYKNVFD